MKWKSNARYNDDPTKGTIFTLEAFPVKVSIHKIHGCGDNYYLSCPDLQLSQHDLKTSIFERAVITAQIVIDTKLQALCETMNPFILDKSDIEIV